MPTPLPRANWVTRWAMDAPVQVGVAGAAWSVAGTFARGLLPRDPVQQAIASGVVSATHYQLTATAWATLQASSALPGQRPGVRANLVSSAIGMAGGLTASALAGPRSATSLPMAAIATAGRITAFAALAGGATSVWDHVLHRRLGLRPGLDTTLLPAVATGAAVVATSLVTRNRRAAQFGLVAPERRAVANIGARSAAKAAAVGVASGLGFAALTTGEQLAAHALERGMSRMTGSRTGALGALIAHATILGAMATVGGIGLAEVTKRIQRRDDVVEPAYPTPPTSTHVSAGPSSRMPFDSLGKEGRRFVLMALTPQEITDVMGEPAIEPVRVVGGYESASDLPTRAELLLADLDACGAYERSVICVGVPTGVGYFNYSFAEALEYLTLGDCAVAVPQYALVPSALALTKTDDAEALTRMVLDGIAEHIAGMPPDRRPRVVLAGESLGANAALDVVRSVDDFAQWGVDHGLYLGVPFRTRLWNAWQERPTIVDPNGVLHLVSQPDEIEPAPPGQPRHLMVIHHDDPVNKYGYRMVLQPPWWMGPPATRPPLVPRESKFRPITSFVLATVDLFNGMQSRPGTFVRRGHDYRIDLRLGIERAYGLTCTSEQADAIESALRSREQQWATRRMVARKLDRARRSIERQLADWGSDGIDVADLDPQAGPQLGAIARLIAVSAPPGS